MNADDHERCELHGGSCVDPYPEPVGKDEALRMNTTALAFLGDAVYEVYVRKYIVDTGATRSEGLHLAAVRFVNAGAQAVAVKAMLDEESGILTDEDERALLRRARNRKSVAKPKNADPMDYKWATAFEALLGYYYVTEQERKLEDAVLFALNRIEGETARK
ncbi:MAG: Mini-ribonuclease 3 [Clostridiales Family XIII bacterium]|jgi:ribonuclease-3 family protein|nr:Mini-ribonuclease 3 [Clostridiales Family XIII bacterium]